MICFYENIQSQLSAYADNHQIYISSEKTDNVINSLEEDGNRTGRHENIWSQLSAYADDHQIYISGEKIDNVMNSLEEDGNTTGHWYKSNYLSGNPSRTGYVPGS